MQMASRQASNHQYLCKADAHTPRESNSWTLTQVSRAATPSTVMVIMHHGNGPLARESTVLSLA